MKKRIYRSLWGLSVLAALLTATLSLWSFYHIMIGQARIDLVAEYDVIEKGLTGADATDIAYLKTLDQQFFRTRLTLINREGDVLYDSAGNRATDNHSLRPEVVAAFGFGTGEAIRPSDTVGENAYYYARRIDDNHVLRIAKLTRSIGTAFLDIVPAMLVIIVLIIVAGIIIAGRLTHLILHPIERLSHDIETAATPDYEELEPFFFKIREQNSLIHQQLETLRAERDTVKTITSNMHEGLILLDPSRNILSVNRSALSLLHTPDGRYENQHILTLCRNPELERCVGEALSGRGATTLISNENQFCRIIASPVHSSGTDEQIGAIVMLLDVTEQQQTEKIRRDFSANVSHELKTPLTSISGFAELMQNGLVQSRADIAHFSSKIYHEAQRLITLTDDIIRLSRIEDNGMIEMEQVELLAICEHTAQNLTFLASQKEIHLEVSGEPIAVHANLRMMEELIGNLVDNGIKYSRPSGSVEIKLAQNEQFAVLTVCDNGIGIPLEYQERIFERFYRVDKSRSKQTGGTGLGLSIVRHIVERHNGTITLLSEPGKGTVITIRLPITTAN